MHNETIAICLSVFFVFLYIPGVFYLFGKGGLSIGGYHYDALSEKGKRYHGIIMRRAGFFYIILIGLLHACIVTSILGKLIACYVLIPIIIIWCILSILYFNYSKKIRFARQQEKMYDEEYRKERTERNGHEQG